MGYYINPSDQTKEEFLVNSGRELPDHEVSGFDFGGEELPVCFVDNGAFTAAGIAYDPIERGVFLRDDGRDKVWFAVKRSLLAPWLPAQWGGKKNVSA